MVASAARRRQIIRDQKNPPNIKVVRYTDAQRAIVSHLVSVPPDPEVLGRHLRRLVARGAGQLTTSYEVQKNQDCQDAIRAFQGMLGSLPFASFVLMEAASSARPLMKGGVAISVRPELFLQGEGRNADPIVGAVKLYFSKTHALSEVAAEYVGTVLHEYGERYLSDRGHATYQAFACHRRIRWKRPHGTTCSRTSPSGR